MRRTSRNRAAPATNAAPVPDVPRTPPPASGTPIGGAESAAPARGYARAASPGAPAASVLKELPQPQPHLRQERQRHRRRRSTAHPRSGTTRRTYVHGCAGGCYGDARASSANPSPSTARTNPSTEHTNPIHASPDTCSSSYSCTTHACAADARAATTNEHAESARAVVHAQADVHAEAYPDTAPDVHAAADAGTHPTHPTLMWSLSLPPPMYLTEPLWPPSAEFWVR